MDIMELGAIGELVSGVAVIGSLIFVGLQIRRSNRLTHAEAVWAYQREYSRAILEPLKDVSYADLLRRGLTDFETLDRSEQVAVHAQLADLLLIGQASFFLRDHAFVPDEFAQTTDDSAVSVLKSPGAAAWWARVRGMWLPEYNDHLERRLTHTADLPALTTALPFFGAEHRERAEV